MRSIAIIPARGGSKRIERKNIREFEGIPIIAYSIRVALSSGCFDEVMVSTDDAEIAEVARNFGAKVPFMRSAATSDDFATTADVLREVLDEYGKLGREFDIMACIYATAPFVTASRLKDAYSLLNDSKAQAAFTCVQYSYPVQRCLTIDDRGRIAMKFPEYASARSQDLQPTYHDAGQFYLSTVKSFLDSGSLWGPDTMPIVLPETEVQDLDTPIDWLLAEMKFRLLSFPKTINLSDYELKDYCDLTRNESQLMLDGRNLPDIRKRMINTTEIESENHFKFVSDLRFDRNKKYYAVFLKDNQSNNNSKPIGSITLERLTPDTAERGIWLFPEYHGKGHATQLLTQLYDYLKYNSNLKEIYTRVRTDNEASLRLENALGASPIGKSEEMIEFKRPLC